MLQSNKRKDDRKNMKNINNVYYFIYVKKCTYFILLQNI